MVLLAIGVSPGSQKQSGELPHSHQPPPGIVCPAKAEAHRKNTMNTEAIRRFLTILSSTVKVERAQLYQLVQSAETSYCLRDIESQRQIGQLLQSFGYPFNQLGKYYESIYLYRTGQFEKARELLESVAESAPARYRSKALLSLSAVEYSIGRFEESLRLHLQTSSTCDDLVTLLEAQRGVAMLRSTEGKHRAALRELERLLPLAHVIGKRGHPSYFAFLNSYALELSESGRVDEAEQVSDAVAASPFIKRYREWEETVSEIQSKRKRRSFVGLTFPPEYGIRDPRIQHAIKFMHANFNRHISLKELAGVAGMSASRFSPVFKNQTGFPPGDYLIRIKIEKARQLLSRGLFSVKEVAGMVGYNTRSNFTDLFKRYVGVTPSEYKKRHLRR
jgi:AraC-like DNA-binding protein